MKNFIYLILAILNLSCNSSVEPNVYLAPLGIELKENYEELENNYSPAIGDLLVEFKLKIHPKDYQNIVEIIQKDKSFRKLDSLEYYPYENASGDFEESQQYACEKKGTYFMHLYIPDPNGSWESYTIYLKEDHILDFQYVDE